MPDKELHLSDQDLVSYADGELSLKRKAVIQEHLASCWSCRARNREIETAIADFVHLYGQDVHSESYPVEGPRALLKARLAETARLSHRNSAAGSVEWVRQRW